MPRNRRALALVQALTLLASLATPALAQTDLATPLAQPRAAQPAITPAMASDAWEEQRWADAANYYRVLSRENPDDGLFAFRLAYALHADGQYRRALPAHENAARFEDYREVSLYNLACAHSALGNTDQAFDALEYAIDQGFDDYDQIARDEDLFPLHDDPRWNALVRREPDPDPRPDPRPRWTPVDDLSFVLGEWEILSTRGQRLGSMSVHPQPSGFALDAIERSDTRDGADETRSIVFYDGVLEAWRLVSIDGDGLVTDLLGQPSRNSRLEFEGEVHTPDGETYFYQLTLTLRRDGNIDVIGLEAEHEGETFRPVFEGTWRRLGIVPPNYPGPGPGPGRPYKPGLAGDKR